jgi:Ni,Fe-hydrogenase I small subunit
MVTFDKMPTLDRQGRPKMFYSQRIHDKCYRRPHFDAGQFVTRAPRNNCLTMFSNFLNLMMKRFTSDNT